MSRSSKKLGTQGEAYEVLERVGRNFLIVLLLAFHVIFFRMSMSVFSEFEWEGMRDNFWSLSYFIAVMLILPALWSFCAVWVVFLQSDILSKKRVLVWGLVILIWVAFHIGMAGI